jgi:type IV pilus assembly protein PilQ
MSRIRLIVLSLILSVSLLFVGWTFGQKEPPDTTLKLHVQNIPQRISSIPKEESTLVSLDTIKKAPEKEILVDTTIIVSLLDFKNTDIRDVFDVLARAYKLNLWLDPSVQGKITVHFANIPLNDVLKVIIEENGLFYDKSDNVIKLYKEEQIAPLPAPLDIEVRDTLLSVDLKDADLFEVVKILVKESKENIVIESGVTGRLSGVLKEIEFEKGLNALMNSNGFMVKKIEGIYHLDRIAVTPGAPAPRRIYSINFKDSLLTIDVTNANLNELVREIATQCNLDIFIYGNLEGQVSAKCKYLSVDDALNNIFKGTKYTFRKEKTVYFIGAKEMEDITATELIKLNHIVADGIIEQIPQTLASKATLKEVKEQNGLMVIGPYNIVKSIKDYITEIDQPPAQILIEALVVDYYQTAYRELGITANNFGLRDSFNLLETYYPYLDIYTHGQELNQNIQDLASRLGIAQVGTLRPDFFVKLYALEQEGKANIRSRPQIATLNGHTAKIDVGTTQYYLLKTETTYPGTQQALSTQVTERFQTIEASMSLSITPWVSASGDIIVEIHPEFNTPQGAFDSKIPPTINHRILDSRNGETIILGGLIQTTESETVKKFPFLGRIPILGRLFQNKTKTKINAELVIYLTPYVYYGSEGSVDISKYRK